MQFFPSLGSLLSRSQGRDKLFANEEGLGNEYQCRYPLPSASSAADLDVESLLHRGDRLPAPNMAQLEVSLHPRNKAALGRSQLSLDAGYSILKGGLILHVKIL